MALSWLSKEDFHLYDTTAWIVPYFQGGRREAMFRQWWSVFSKMILQALQTCPIIPGTYSHAWPFDQSWEVVAPTLLLTCAFEDVERLSHGHMLRDFCYLCQFAHGDAAILQEMFFDVGDVFPRNCCCWTACPWLIVQRLSPWPEVVNPVINCWLWHNFFTKHVEQSTHSFICTGPFFP